MDALPSSAAPQPRFPGTNAIRAQAQFDDLLQPGQTPIRLELRMIYWAPLSIPFADWVFSRLALAHTPMT